MKEDTLLISSDRSPQSQLCDRFLTKLQSCHMSHQPLFQGN